MKIQDSYDSNGGEYILCPHCESHWYLDSPEIGWNEEIDNEDGDTICVNCGKEFWMYDDTKIDPSEDDVKAMFEDGYSEFIREHGDDDIALNEAYNNYTDGLCKDEIISTLMYESMQAYR